MAGGTIDNVENKKINASIKKSKNYSGVQAMIFGKKDSDSDNSNERVKELERQNKVMREALEFYANTDSWSAGHKYRDADDATIFTDGGESAATIDKGNRAYRALEACK